MQPGTRRDKKRFSISIGVALTVHLTVILLAGALPQGLSRGISPLGTMYGVDMMDLDALARMETADHYSIEGKPGPATSGKAGSSGNAVRPGGPKTTATPQTNKPASVKPISQKQPVKPAASSAKSISSKPVTSVRTATASASSSTKASNTKLVASTSPAQPKQPTQPAAKSDVRIITGNSSTTSAATSKSGHEAAVTVASNSSANQVLNSPAVENGVPAGVSGNGNLKGEAGGKGTGKGMGVGDGNGYGVGSGSGSGTGFGKESGGPPPPPSFGDGREAVVKMPLPRFPKENPDDDGTVALVVRVGADGKADNATVVRSSRIASMDRTAKLTAERLWAYAAKGFSYDVDVEITFAHDDTASAALGAAAVHVGLGKWRRVAASN